MPDLSQILDSVSLGLVVLDRHLRVLYWNPWMARHSGVSTERILGTPLFDHFPGLDTPAFHRNRRAVMAIGNFAYFSQKLHKQLFPFPLSGALATWFPLMQQNCTMGPVREADGSISGLFILVQDVTELALHEQRLLQMSGQDALTGVHNRRHFDLKLKEEMDRARRYGSPLSLILMDVDHFKAVNDAHGHEAGDLVLTGLCARLGARIRSSDCFARLGGEEFACLMPETDGEAAVLLAERFREAMADEPFDLEASEVSVTLSLGVASLLPGEEARVFVGRADAAMYKAKEEGRNGVRRL